MFHFQSTTPDIDFHSAQSSHQAFQAQSVWKREREERKRRNVVVDVIASGYSRGKRLSLFLTTAIVRERDWRRLLRQQIRAPKQLETQTAFAWPRGHDDEPPTLNRNDRLCRRARSDVIRFQSQEVNQTALVSPPDLVNNRFDSSSS